MSKPDFQNGFILGMVTKGQVSSNWDALDHTVQFLANGGIYEIVKVKDGNSVRAPATDPVGFDFGGWGDVFGNLQAFPFMPTKDTVFTAIELSLSDLLYEHYGVDKYAYPFIYIGTSQTAQMAYYDSAVYFFESCEFVDNGISAVNALWYNTRLYHSSVTEDMISDAETLIRYLLTREPTSKPAMEGYSGNILDSADEYGDGRYYYMNFDGLSDWRDGYRFY